MPIYELRVNIDGTERCFSSKENFEEKCTILALDSEDKPLITIWTLLADSDEEALDAYKESPYGPGEDIDELIKKALS